MGSLTTALISPDGKYIGAAINNTIQLFELATFNAKGQSP
jgi:hypothetical protein